MDPDHRPSNCQIEPRIFKELWETMLFKCIFFLNKNVGEKKVLPSVKIHHVSQKAQLQNNQIFHFFSTTYWVTLKILNILGVVKKLWIEFGGRGGNLHHVYELFLRWFLGNIDKIQRQIGYRIILKMKEHMDYYIHNFFPMAKKN